MTPRRRAPSSRGSASSTPAWRAAPATRNTVFTERRTPKRRTPKRGLKLLGTLVSSSCQLGVERRARDRSRAGARRRRRRGGGRPERPHLEAAARQSLCDLHLRRGVRLRGLHLVRVATKRHSAVELDVREAQARVARAVRACAGVQLASSGMSVAKAEPRVTPRGGRERQGVGERTDQ